MKGWGWVAVQAALLLGLAAAPRGSTWPGWPGWLEAAIGWGGAAICAAGLVKGLRDLGASFRVNPVPKEGAALVMSGLYGLVRHPMYTVVLAGAGAFAFSSLSPWRWAVAGLLCAFFWMKARHEEALLEASHPGYREYRARVGMFFPRLLGRKG